MEFPLSCLKQASCQVYATVKREWMANDERIIALPGFTGTDKTRRRIARYA
jgi:hypothetical protein